ncbi:transcriptional regulator [Thalassotalea insulae]|uniref:Transcriptional regulator n=1 Tax=Thalassotalea insulae TaxID=2056778 RepID=A0ABQ6GY12_9GAMM|nr:helix-turn-helix domain-containing protein [Thalassotalea insulae]GLX79516.1 transcriptional regulator [Thalassotalea insulae]
MAEFFYHIAFAQMALCALLLFPYRALNSSIPLFILLMVCSCGYLVSYSFGDLASHSVLWWIGHIGGNALPGVFWLVSLSVFGDHTVLKRGQYLVASLTLVIPFTAELVQQLFTIELADYEAIYGLVTYGGLLLELVLISHALVISFCQWRDDLVQERRYIRGGVITIASVYIIMVIIAEELFRIEWQWLDLSKSFMLVVLVTGINFFLFRLKESSLFETVKAAEIDSQRRAALTPGSKELARIVASMEQDKLYQQDGMTIAGLAKHLAIHEYKLRNLINGKLNYRNFNDFLNYYRIKEVTDALTDPTFQSTPVLTLALESGFRSLSSFNKAFKATHGITPTEFRKRNLQQP